MSIIRLSDPDFRIFHINFDTLLQIQVEAEQKGWGTRWTSVNALRGQVKDDFVLLQSLMREERDGAVRSYRCLVLFSAADEDRSGGITTIDLSPHRYYSLERLDRDPDVRASIARIFSLSLVRISEVTKE